MMRDAAWQVLIASARDYAESPDANFAKALSLSAIAWTPVDEGATARGAGGFGSTGR